MSDISSFIPGGKTALGQLFAANLQNENVQAFLKEAKTRYETDSEFKSEIERAGLQVPSTTNVSVNANSLNLSGLTEQEKARVLNAIQGAPSSSASRYAGANSGQAINDVSTNGSDYTKWLIALGIAAVVAIVVFRGVVFRTLYFLACKLPLIGDALRAKFGEPREIISGKLSENTRKTLISEVKELSDLLGVSGYRDEEANLARLVRLLRKLNPEDIQEVMDAAKDYKRIG